MTNANEFATPVPTESEEVSIEPQAQEQGQVEGSKKTPKQEYNENELLAIFDEIIFSGEYSEKVSIRGKLNVTLRARTAKDISDITSKLDSTPANLISTVNERRALMNLFYALINYQGKDIGQAKIEDREKFIKNLPAPIIGTLLVALDRFDKKVYKACEVGEENF